MVRRAAAAAANGSGMRVAACVLVAVAAVLAVAPGARAAHAGLLQPEQWPAELAGSVITADEYRFAEALEEEAREEAEREAAVAAHVALLAEAEAARPKPKNVSSTNSSWVPCLKDCSKRGYCDGAGHCRCISGWQGADCSEAVCVNNCNAPNGVCNTTTQQCQCSPGFYGLACDIKGCLYDCFNNGYCHQEHGCVCKAGFEGIYCQNEIGCPNACNKRGACFNGTCLCEDGYSGPACEQLVCPNNCNQRGKCNAATGTCTCDPQFFGLACEFRSCPDHCSERGMCNTTTGTCECFPGFWGANCAPQNCKFDCSGNGKCHYNNATQRSTCTCDAKYTGEGCEAELCPKQCSAAEGHGNCTAAGCQCFPDWTGPDCSERRCPNDCSGPSNGLCDNSTWQCSCVNGWTGASCNELICPGACNFRGVCNNGTCACDDWWTGRKCEVAQCKKDQLGRACSAHGKCILPSAGPTPSEQLNAALNAGADPQTMAGAALQQSGDQQKAFCQCDDGWGGTDCSLKQCLNDCSGRGICESGVCFCEKGYYGEDCSVVAALVNNKLPWSADQLSLQKCKATCQHGKCLLREGTSSEPGSHDSITGATIAAARPEFACHCEPDWGGSDCSVPLNKCPAGCTKPDGSCVEGCLAHVVCPKSFGHPCGGNKRGRCTPQGTCRCNAPYGGKACESVACPLNCSGRGYCNTKLSTCLCPAGWGGRGCELKLFETD